MDAAYFLIGPAHREQITEHYHRSLVALIRDNHDCHFTPWIAVQRSEGEAEGFFVALDEFGNWELAVDAEARSTGHPGRQKHFHRADALYAGTGAGRGRVF